MEQSEGVTPNKEIEETTLTPREQTPVIINTLRSTVYDPAVMLYKTFSDQIKDIPEMASFAQEMEDASIDTNADIELMTEVAELGLKGHPIKIVKRIENTEKGEDDRSFLYLGPRTNQPDVEPSTISTVEQPTPEQLNGLLLRTIENRTRNAMSMVQIYPEIALMSTPNHPKSAEVNAFITKAKEVTNNALQLEKVGYEAMRGNPVKIANDSRGNRTFK